MARKARSEGCEIDMTPMIDIVFQLIIFFVVTLKMTSDFNPDIILEDGKHGPVITQENTPSTTLTVEIAKNGRVSIHNATLSDERLRTLLRARVNRMGNEFPILIRADRRTPHEHIKRVMDACTESDVWKLQFVAVQDPKASSKK